MSDRGTQHRFGAVYGASGMKGGDVYSGSGTDEEPLRGYDYFYVTLGDQIRGERATMGLSLLDIQRQLRIKAEYLAAIEDCNPAGFDGPGFIAGYVRSYARFLGLDPDEAYEKFCRESGFAGVHGAGLSKPAEPARKIEPRRPVSADPVLGRGVPQTSTITPWYAQLDPGSLGSAAVLIALILGLGYGGLSVVRELQRVNVVPVEAQPTLLSEIDPLDGVRPAADTTIETAEVTSPSVDALDRLYRPQVLDAPVLTPRDGPIGMIDPDETGLLAAPAAPQLAMAEADPVAPVQVVADAAPDVTVIATAAAWVRVRAADGTILLEKIMEPGERFALPESEAPPVLRAGAAGSVFFSVGGTIYGPAGTAGAVASNVELSPEALRERYQMADLEADPELAAVVNVANAED